MLIIVVIFYCVRNLIKISIFTHRMVSVKSIDLHINKTEVFQLQSNATLASNKGSSLDMVLTGENRAELLAVKNQNRFAHNGANW